MIRIRDPLHGTIQLSELEGKLLDSRHMQRLRGIRQLAMAYLVYPGANHTRFEHSIGTLYLADKICRELGMGKDKASQVRAAALLHDVGHTAYSHEAESVLKRFIGTHEETGREMMAKGELADILSEQFSPRKIASLAGEPLGGIITSDVGADRMDYLLRDSHYTGVAYGVIDSDRVCSTVAIDPKGLYITERGLPAAESLLVARFTMFSTVYLHKTVRIASRMLQESISLALSDGTLEAADALCMADAAMLQTLSRSPAGGGFARRLAERRLFKKAHSIPLSEMKVGPAAAERLLADKCGCPVLIDIPKLSLSAHVRLERKGRKVPLSEKSEIIASLQRMQKSRLDALVICEEKCVGKVSAAAKRLL
ncbi:Deoxyguanosinetriphosphate triphosphohydrolase-like protein [uncultured archaeon]|nr:Deoxyguanosinetriphosphate triphosphohydrolase-like protein [uncultured archaeon]